MNHSTKRAWLFLGIVAFLLPNVGCATMPWKATKPATTVAEDQYAQEAVENIEYDTSVDFAQDYRPSPVNSSSYSQPSNKTPSGTGDSCTSGCCH